MIGMDFISFIILLIIAVVTAYFLHYILKLYVVPGFWSFVCKVIIGWIGAWLGSPVFGYWFSTINYQNIYIIPAILGALALQILIVDIVKTLKSSS